jgi:hypothetical protein
MKLSRGPVHPLGWLAVAIVLALLPTGRAFGSLKVVCVARRPTQPTYAHDAISGIEVLLAGAAYADGAALTEYQWQFGDGTVSPRVAVENSLALEARHAYAGPVGRVFRATLTVWDESGAFGSGEYYVRLRPDTLRTRVHIACDFALWNLHKRLKRYEEDGVALGYWDNDGYGNHIAGMTAGCLQAFENLGNFPFDDPDGSPYVDDVRRALNQLLILTKPQTISVQAAGDPDANGNGIGLLCHQGEDPQHIFSSEGLTLTALVMSRDPGGIASVGGPDVAGRTLADIVQDMVDFLAYGQTEENVGEMGTRGGWRYQSPNSGEADMACTQWPVLGMMTAEKNWGKHGVSVPAWVKSELRENLLVAAHDEPTGGWLYLPTPTSRTNCGLTGIGILCSAWAGVPFSDATVTGGLGYIVSDWNATGQFGHLTSMFSMNAVANAMRAYESAMIGERNWYEEYAAHLLANQNADGSWSSEGYERSWPLTTAWGTLILLEPQTPPSVVIEELASAQQGTVPISYQLFDDNYDECDVLVEFSADGGKTWSVASQAGGDTLILVEAQPEGVSRQFLWDAEADFGKNNVDNVLLRITPSDGEQGEAAQIVVPGVYNDVVPFERVELDVPLADGRGVSSADFDNDGDLDVFVANFGQENFLLRNDTGKLALATGDAGLGGIFLSTCGVWGDFNNDGAPDLYLVVGGRPNKLYRGDGQGRFTDVAPTLRVDNSGGGTAASWVDYNNDHWLDLYVGNDSALGSASNAFYRNTSGSGFLNLAGFLGVNCPFPTRAAAWSDFDRDGRTDLYVVNGGVTAEERSNSLFQNLLETFADVAATAGVSDPRDGKAAVWADFNADGYPDLYVVNSGLEGNALYLNNQNGTFRDETAEAGLQGPPEGQNAAVADIDNDGDLDVFVSAKGRNALFINRGDCTFADAATVAGITDVADSRGAAWLDVNGDGFLDIYVANSGARDVLYLNRRTDGNWLRVRCLTDADGDATDEDASDDRDAIGAIIEVDLDGNVNFSATSPDRLEVQCVDGGSGAGCQGQLWPHFGLGNSMRADVRVIFPDGSVVYRCGLSANQAVTVRDISPRGELYAQVFTPETVVSGLVPIGYILFNSAEKSCEIRVEVSFDSGASWIPAVAGQGGEATKGLLSSPQGVLHRYVWDSLNDLGQTNSDSVRIRIIPYDPNPGFPAETSDFSVNNNTLPWVSVETPSGTSTGDIAIRYTLYDTQSDPCLIEVEYSVDGGTSWPDAAMGSGGDGTRALPSSLGGMAHTFVWDSFANVGHKVRDDVRIRITPVDMQVGTAGETGPFRVDNNMPPSAIIETPLSGQSGSIPLSYVLVDGESDACSVAVHYSLDGGRTWLAASKAAGSEGTSGLKSSPSGEAHAYLWDSLADLGEDYVSAIRMRIIPQDAKIGAPAQTGDFVVDNLRPAELAFSPAAFLFLAVEGGDPPPSQTLEVWNEGSHSLEWSAESDAGWLILDPSTGVSSGAKSNVVVSVDMTGLREGTYHGNITLSAAQALGSPATIPVTLEVQPAPPTLQVSEVLLSFNARDGGANPAAQLVHVRNAGSGELFWSAVADQDWVTLLPSSGSSTGESDAVEVRVNIDGLPAGSYPGAITISSPNAANSPQQVVVSLDIELAVTELLISPSEVTLVTRRGGANPPEQELRLTVSGGATVEWQAAYDAPWLFVAPASGTNSGEETLIHVAVEKSGLYIGDYESEVTFSAVGQPLSPAKVRVILRLVPIVVPDDFPTIREAMEEALSLDLISVRPGVYRENVLMKNDVELRGSGADVTTIQAESPGSTLVFQDLNSSILEGFAVTGGSGSLFGKESRVGGGAYCVNSAALLSNCVISGNSATWGGGVCVDRGSTLTLEDCTVSGNTAASGGGVFCYESCEAFLDRTRLSENIAEQSGGGACVISGGSIVLTSCEVVRNTGTLGGGGIFAASLSVLDVISSTVADNTGEGILADPGSTIRAINTIVWSNGNDPFIPTGQDVRHCDMEGSLFVGSNGNISQEPLFVAPGEGCYQLLPNSPCIDAGLQGVAGLPTADIQREPRTIAVYGEPITDIGADEHDPQTIFVLVEPVPTIGAGGSVTLRYTIWNALALSTSIEVEFAVGGSEWRPASRAGGEGMIDLSSSPGGSPHSFIWDSVPDTKGLNTKSLRLRIRLAGETARPGGTTGPFSLNANLSDSDTDGLPDAWENTIVSADPDDDLNTIEDVTPDGDPDADGATNLNEYIARTDPLNANSVFRATCSVGEAGEIIVRWSSVAGRFYRVYTAERMGQPWSPVGQAQAGNGERMSFVDNTLDGNARQRYYVVRVE